MLEPTLTALLLGVATSLVLGVADFNGGLASRTSNAAKVVFFGALVSFPLAVVALVIIGGEFVSGDIGWGLLAGLANAIGLAVLYRGFSVAGTGLVAPTASVLSVMVPVGVDLAGGASIAALGWFGVVIAVVSLAVATFTPDGVNARRSGVTHGLVAGVCFGIGLAALGGTGEGAGLWPLLWQRVGIVSSLAIFVGVLSRRSSGQEPSPWPLRSDRTGSFLSGALSVVGLACFVAGTQRGDLATVSVAGTQFPVVTIVLMALFADERLRSWQWCGVVGVAVGVTLVGIA